MPGVPLDDALLAMLSVGLPVGLGIYFAWVHRDWPARARPSGSLRRPRARSPAPGSGFHAAADLLALVTAIVGATAGANLTLILLDISRARSLEGRAPARANASVPGVEPA